MEKASLNFHSSWLNLPLSKSFKGINLQYSIEKIPGTIYDDVHYIIQIVYNGQCSTLEFTIYHTFLDRDYCEYSVFNTNLKRFDDLYPISLPDKIKERYPLLSLLRQNKTDCKYLTFFSFKDTSIFSTCRLKAIKEGPLTDIQAAYIINVVDTVQRAEREFDNYRKSVIYKCLKEVSRNKIKQQENTQIAVGIYKVLRYGLLCYNLLNGNNDSFQGFDGDSSINLNGVDLNGLFFDGDILSRINNDSEIVDFLTSPVDKLQTIELGEQISFGNSYDENAVKFISKCQELGVEMPNSVNNSTDTYSIEVDRGYNGGLSGIDKSIIGSKLENLLNSGNLSQSDYKDLKDMLSKT